MNTQNSRFRYSRLTILAISTGILIMNGCATSTNSNSPSSPPERTAIDQGGIESTSSPTSALPELNQVGVFGEFDLIVPQDWKLDSLSDTDKLPYYLTADGKPVLNVTVLAISSEQDFDPSWSVADGVVPNLPELKVYKGSQTSEYTSGKIKEIGIVFYDTKTNTGYSLNFNEQLVSEQLAIAIAKTFVLKK